MARITTSGFRIGRCTVLPTLNRITGSRTSVRIEPKAMQVLVCLAEKAGDTVTRPDLMRRVWPRTAVTDDVLTRCVGLLRAAFEKSAGERDLLETIPTKGYRLTRPVDPVQGVDSSTLGEIGSRSVPRRPPWILAGSITILALLILALLSVWSIPSRPFPSPLQPIPVTSDPGIEVHAAISPDGRSVAFIRQGAGIDEWDLYVLDLETRIRSRLTSDGAYKGGTSWSSDGSQIAFIRHSDGCSVRLADVETGQETELTECSPGPGYGLDLSWSSDGRWLAYSAGPRLGPASIVLLEIAAGEETVLTSPPANWRGDFAAAFSGDSKSLAFVRKENAAVGDLYVIRLGSSRITRLTHDRANIAGVTWDSSDRRLFFSSNRDGDQLLWEIASTGGRPRWVPIEDRQIFNPRIARRHPTLSYSQRRLDSNLWLTALEGGALEVFEASTYVEKNPAFSPQAEMLAFVSDRSGKEQIWVRDLRSERSRPLTQMDDVLFGALAWRPDAQRIAFAVIHEGDSDIYTVGLEDGTLERWTDGPGNERNPSWSRDAEWLYFSSDVDDAGQIWKIAAAGGAAVQVTRDGGWRAQECGPFHLCYSKPETPGLWARSLTRPIEEKRLIPDLAVRDWANWAATPKGVYYVERSKGRPDLFFFEFATSDVRRVSALPGLIGSPSLSFASSPNRVVFTKLDRGESNVMVVPNFPRN